MCGVVVGGVIGCDVWCCSCVQLWGCCCCDGVWLRVVACGWLCWCVDVIVGWGVRCGVVACVWLAVLSVVFSYGVVLACVGVIGCVVGCCVVLVC